MTKREGAILSAYTGILLCADINVYYTYIEELMNRPVFTHEIPSLAEQIKVRATEDFRALIEAQTGD